MPTFLQSKRSVIITLLIILAVFVMMMIEYVYGLKSPAVKTQTQSSGSSVIHVTSTLPINNSQEGKLPQPTTIQRTMPEQNTPLPISSNKYVKFNLPKGWSQQIYSGPGSSDMTIVITSSDRSPSALTDINTTGVTITIYRLAGQSSSVQAQMGDYSTLTPAPSQVEIGGIPAINYWLTGNPATDIYIIPQGNIATWDIYVTYGNIPSLQYVESLHSSDIYKIIQSILFR